MVAKSTETRENPTTDQLHVATYVAAICKELEKLALEADMKSLAYFIGMARLEAEDHAEAGGRARGERQKH